MVGLLKEEADRLDPEAAWAAIGQELARKHSDQARALQDILLRKQTIVRRPLQRLIDRPHLLSGWLSRFRASWRFDNDHLRWTRNPLDVLADTYHQLNMDDQAGEPPAFVIWDHDARLLEKGLGFYRNLETRLGSTSFEELDALLQKPTPPAGWDEALWAKVRGAHLGHQAGLTLLGLLPIIGRNVGFDGLRMRPDLTIEIPDRLHDPKLQARMKKVLVPPPKATLRRSRGHQRGYVLCA